MHATLTDFGLCRAINNSTIIGTRTMMTGSPGFQAPEQLRAESLGPHCDIYAFGCVMIVTFQERVLWPGLNPYQILCKVSVHNECPDTTDLTGNVKYNMQEVPGIYGTKTSSSCSPSFTFGHS